MISIPDYIINDKLHESHKTLIHRGLKESENLPVVLKILHNEYPGIAELERYRHEYEIIKRFDHDGIIKCYFDDLYSHNPLDGIESENFGLSTRLTNYDQFFS